MHALYKYSMVVQCSPTANLVGSNLFFPPLSASYYFVTINEHGCADEQCNMDETSKICWHSGIIKSAKIIQIGISLWKCHYTEPLVCTQFLKI